MLHPTPSASRGQHSVDPEYRDVENLRRSITAMNDACHARISALKAGTHRLTEGYTELRESYVELRAEIAAIRQELDEFEHAPDA
jgi:uncharacterized coiled-coil DUF342 family protein